MVIARKTTTAGAEGIEHYVSESTLAAFSRFLAKRPSDSALTRQPGRLGPSGSGAGSQEAKE